MKFTVTSVKTETRTPKAWFDVDGDLVIRDEDGDGVVLTKHGSVIPNNAYEGPPDNAQDVFYEGDSITITL